MSYEQLDEFVAFNSTKDEVNHSWVCNICAVTKISLADVKRHIEAIHCILPPLSCTICQKPAKTRNSLAKHMGTYHKNAMI